MLSTSSAKSQQYNFDSIQIQKIVKIIAERDMLRENNELIEKRLRITEDKFNNCDKTKDEFFELYTELNSVYEYDIRELRKEVADKDAKLSKQKKLKWIFAGGGLAIGILLVILL